MQAEVDCPGLTNCLGVVIACDTGTALVVKAIATDKKSAIVVSCDFGHRLSLVCRCGCVAAFGRLIVVPP